MRPATDAGRGERLVLRPGWFLVTTWVLGAAGFLLFAAIGWASILGGEPSPLGWTFAVGGTLVGAILIALLLRCRLILTPEGFRLRRLWKGRLVPWSAVRSFAAIDDLGAPAIVIRGVRWEPTDQPSSGLRRWAYTYLFIDRFEIPVFGGSRQRMLQELESWLDRYS